MTRPWVGIFICSFTLLAVTRAGAQPRSGGAQAEPEGALLQLRLPGELALRQSAMTTLPLEVTPGSRTMPPSLGQNLWFESWIRMRPRLSIGPRFRVQFSFDLARAVIADQPAAGVSIEREPRTETLPYGALDLRTGYLEWDAPVGLFRVGQQGFTWGLGMLANDGEQRPLFGDYRHGDLVERVAFATRPMGPHSSIVTAVAGDLVYRDRVTRLDRGDVAVQGVLSLFYQHHACVERCEERRVGALLSYRDLSFGNGRMLRVWAADLAARWRWPTPDGSGEVFAGVEAALVAGRTDAAETSLQRTHEVLQFGALAELGIARPGRYRVVLEGGYSSGDRNPLDGRQGRFTFNPSHRVGLLLFPEVLQWQVARSAEIARDPELAARPANGASLLTTQGGVANAAYLYPQGQVQLGPYLDLRAAMVIGVSSSDVVDPSAVQRYGEARNYRGGDASRRDLGLEVDLGLEARYPLEQGLVVQGGVQGAVLFPGRALDAAMGQPMPRMGLLTARVGLSF